MAAAAAAPALLLLLLLSSSDRNARCTSGNWPWGSAAIGAGRVEESFSEDSKDAGETDDDGDEDDDDGSGDDGARSESCKLNC